MTAPPSDRSRAQAAAEAVELLVTDPDGPGGAVVVVDLHGVSIACRGRAVLEHRIDVGEHTPMYTASLAKIVTALAVHRAVDDGAFTRDATLDRWFPELAGASSITVAHLLQHRSGLPEYHALRLLAGHHVEDRLTPADVIGLVAGMSPWFAAGSRVSYNNTNYAVLAEIVAREAGTSWSEAVRRAVLDPVGATDGGVRDDPGWTVAGMAGCYVPAGAGSWRRSLQGCTSVGDGGLWLSPADLAALLRALLVPDGALGPAVAALSHVDPLPDGSVPALASGCTTGATAGHRWFGGLAEFVGAKAELRVYPDDGLAVAVVANTAASPVGAAVDRAVIAATGWRSADSPDSPDSPEAPEVPEVPELEHGPAPSGWWIGATGGAWRFEASAEGEGTREGLRVTTGTLRFDAAPSPDGHGWAVVARPSVRVGWHGAELVVRDGTAELARLRPGPSVPVDAATLAAVAGHHECPSARTTLVVSVAPPDGSITAGVTVRRGSLPPEPGEVLGLDERGPTVVIATSWGLLRLAADGLRGAAVLGRAEAVPLLRIGRGDGIGGSGTR